MSTANQFSTKGDPATVTPLGMLTPTTLRTQLSHLSESFGSSVTRRDSTDSLMVNAGDDGSLPYGAAKQSVTVPLSQLRTMPRRQMSGGRGGSNREVVPALGGSARTLITLPFDGSASGGPGEQQQQQQGSSLQQRYNLGRARVADDASSPSPLWPHGSGSTVDNNVATPSHTQECTLTLPVEAGSGCCWVSCLFCHPRQCFVLLLSPRVDLRVCVCIRQ